MHIVQMGLAGWFAFSATFVVAWVVACEVTRRRNKARAAAMRRHPATLAADEHAAYAARLIAELEAELILAAEKNRK